MLTKNARTISGDRLRFTMIRLARFFRWTDNLFESAAVEGRKSAEAARMEVNRNAERARTKLTVWTAGSSPHLVWDRF